MTHPDQPKPNGQTPAEAATDLASENKALWDELHRRDTAADQPDTAPAAPAEGSDQRRQQYARAMAEAVGSKCFREPGREWDHMRSVWLAHADAVLPLADAETAQLRQQLTDARRQLDETANRAAAAITAMGADLRAAEHCASTYRAAWYSARRDRRNLRAQLDTQTEKAGDCAEMVKDQRRRADALARAHTIADRLDEFAETTVRVDDRALYRALAADLRTALDTGRPQP